jgi:hypothetical protein
MRPSVGQRRISPKIADVALVILAGAAAYVFIPRKELGH